MDDINQLQEEADSAEIVRLDKDHAIEVARLRALLAETERFSGLCLLAWRFARSAPAALVSRIRSRLAGLLRVF